MGKDISRYSAPLVAGIMNSETFHGPGLVMLSSLNVNSATGGIETGAKGLHQGGTIGRDIVEA